VLCIVLQITCGDAEISRPDSTRVSISVPRCNKPDECLFMKIAVLSDIHANLEALRACLAHAEGEGAGMHAFLGDLVGYGADPVACLGLLADHAVKGALLVRGNHDEAALGGLCEDMNPVARAKAAWPCFILSLRSEAANPAC